MSVLRRSGIAILIFASLQFHHDTARSLSISVWSKRLTSASEAERSVILWTGLLSTFTLGCLAGMLGWFASGFVFERLAGMSDLARTEASGAIAWMLAALPLLLPTSALSGALQARGRFGAINVVQVLGSLASQLVPLGVALLGHKDIAILVPAALVSRIGVLAALFWQCRRHVPLQNGPLFDLRHMKEMLSYGGWVSVMTFLAPLLVTIDRLVIAAVSGAKAVAFYTIPHDLVSRSQIISGSLANAIFPRLAAGTEAEAEELSHRATASLIAVMSPLIVAGLFLVHPFLVLWLGNDVAASGAGVAELIAVGVWVNALVIPHHSRFMARGNPRTVAMIYLGEIPIYFAMLYFGLLHWGIAGAAAAWSARVTIDTTALLILNRALGRTMRTAAPYAPLVIIATVVALGRPFDPIWHWALATALVSMATYVGRHALIGGIISLRRPEVIA